MDQTTSRSHTGRSSPETTTSHPGSRLASDRSPSWTNQYQCVWAMPADSGSIPRYMPDSPTPRSSMPAALEPLTSNPITNYTLRSSPRYGVVNPVPDKIEVLPDIGHCGLSRKGEQSSHEENEDPSRPYHSVLPRDPNLPAHAPSFDPESGQGFHTSCTVDETVTRSTAKPGIGPGPPSSDLYHERPCCVDPIPEDGEHGDFTQPNYSDTDTALKSQGHHILASPADAGPSTSGTIGEFRARPLRDAPYALDLTFCKALNHYFIDVHNQQLDSMPVVWPDTNQVPLENLATTKENDQHLCQLPKGDHGHSTTGTDFPSAQTEGMAASGIGTRNSSHSEDVESVEEGTVPSQIHVESWSSDLIASLNLSSNSGSIGSPASTSPATRPGLNMSGQQDDSRTTPVSSTAPIDVSKTASLDDTSLNNVYGPASIVLDSLRRQLTTCLLAGWLWNSISFDFHNVAVTFRSRPQGSGAGQARRGAGKRRLTASSPQSNSSSWRAESGDESDCGGEDAPRRRKRKTQKANTSPSDSPRLLACPFHKMNPLRYSALNESEKEYRNCSSGYWPDISRLKQHLDRAHKKPAFYCRSCFVIFEDEADLDHHHTQRPACVIPSQRKFEEKISGQQMTEIKKRRPGLSIVDRRNLIFTVLFPQTDVPESPYMATSELELVKKLQSHLCQEAPRILSSLFQRRFQAASPLGPIHPDLLDGICEQSTQECIPLALQLLASGGVPALRQSPADNFVSQQFRRGGPSHSQNLVQPWLATAPPPNGLLGRTLPHSQVFPSQDDLYPHQSSSSSLEQHPTHCNMDPIHPNTADFYQHSLPELVSDEVLSAQLDFDLPQIYDFVDENTSFWDSSPLMHRVGLDHACF